MMTSTCCCFVLSAPVKSDTRWILWRLHTTVCLQLSRDLQVRRRQENSRRPRKESRGGRGDGRSVESSAGRVSLPPRDRDLPVSIQTSAVNVHRTWTITGRTFMLESQKADSKFAAGQPSLEGFEGKHGGRFFSEISSRSSCLTKALLSSSLRSHWVR